MKIPHFFIILVICLVCEISEGKFNCEEPTLRNGRVRIRSKGRIARFRCRKKFKLYGPKIALCINDEWNIPPPTCVAPGRKCPKLKPSKDLIVSKELKDGVWELSCPSGQQLRGRDFIYCDGSRWSDELPTCVSTKTTTISTTTGNLNESYTTLASYTVESRSTRSTLLTSIETVETTSTTTDNDKERTNTDIPQTTSSVYISTTPEEVLQTTTASRPRDRPNETTTTTTITTNPRPREQPSETTTTLMTSSTAGTTLLSTKISRKSIETTTLKPGTTTLKPEIKTQNSRTIQKTTTEFTTTQPKIFSISTEPMTEKQITTISSVLPRKTTTTAMPKTTYKPTKLTSTSPSSTSMKITTLVSTTKPLTSVTTQIPSTTPPVIPVSSTSGLPTSTTTTVTTTTVATTTTTATKKPGLSTSAITTNPVPLSPENSNLPTNEETTSTVTAPSRRIASPSPNSPPGVNTSKSQIPTTTTITTTTKTTTSSSDYFNNTINEETITKPPTNVNETDIPNVIPVVGQQSAADDTPIQPLMIGLGVGVAIGLVIVILGSYMWIRRRRRKEEECDEMAPITGTGSQEW